MFVWGTVKTALSGLTVGVSAEGLACLSFQRPEATLRELGRKGEVRRATAADSGFHEVAEELVHYADGTLTSFTVPVDWCLTSGAQRRVLQCLYETVPYGATTTYGQLAGRCGRPGAARLVGQIMGSNPIPVVVPCHRVLAAGGLGGYGPGLDVKRRLLALEGALEPTLFP